MDHKVTRCVQILEKGTNNLKGYLNFQYTPSLSALQRAFKVGALDPLYGRYPIDNNNKDTVQQYIKEELDLNNFDYVLMVRK